MHATQMGLTKTHREELISDIGMNTVEKSNITASQSSVDAILGIRIALKK